MYTGEDVSFLPPLCEGSMQSRMSGEGFFKLHMLHMALGVGEGRGVCVSGPPPVDSSAGYR